MQRYFFKVSFFRVEIFVHTIFFYFYFSLSARRYTRDEEQLSKLFDYI